MIRQAASVLVFGVMFASPIRAGAHHGAAAYDQGATRTLDAVVTSFKWTNPHALIEFDTRDASGDLQHWTAETAGLTILVRAGWSKTVIDNGSRVTISGHPAHNGSPTMILERVVLPDGRVLNNFVPK
jgi:hypothetical protein